MVWYPTNSGIDVEILEEGSVELITLEDGFTSRVNEFLRRISEPPRNVSKTVNKTVINKTINNYGVPVKKNHKIKNSGYVTKDFLKKKLDPQIQKFVYQKSKQGYREAKREYNKNSVTVWLKNDRTGHKIFNEFFC